MTSNTSPNDGNRTIGGSSIFPERVMKLIKSHIATMSRGQAQIADYIIKNKDTFWLLSMQELAKKAGVSHATVIRFCRSLGYKGFSDFSRNASDIMQVEISVANRFNISSSTPVREKTPGQTSMFMQVLHKEVESINALAHDVSSDEFSECVSMMLQADAIFILARMSSFPIALHFESTLSKACSKSYLIPEGELQAAAFLKRITERSLLFSIAYTRYATSTVTFTEMAHEKGCSVVALTNSLLSPLVQYSKLRFIVSTPMLSFADLFAAPYALVSALAIEYGVRAKQQTESSLREFDNIMVQRKNVIT